MWLWLFNHIPHFVLGLGGGAVGIFLAKFLPKEEKWLLLAKDMLEILEDVDVALKNMSRTPPVQLTQDQVNHLLSEIRQLKNDLSNKELDKLEN